jgi:hypothetical protein
MKKEIYFFRLSVFFLAFIIVFACQKTVPNANQNSNQRLSQNNPSNPDSPTLQTVPFPESPVSDCPYAPNYGSSVIYPQPTSGSNDYIVSPINNPGVGTYLSWPQGLVIDPTTGAINLTKSQTGQRYDIGFVKSGTTDTCITQLIVGGALYIDSVYVMANDAYQVYSYYNANPALVWNCPSTGGSGSCRFDITGSAKNAHVSIDPNNGWIDLKKTLIDGAFGPIPFDGQIISVPIFYQLNDGSNMAIQNITVNIIYYSSKSSIPSLLLNTLRTKLNNFQTNQLIQKSGNPRPPLIIITRDN